MSHHSGFIKQSIKNVDLGKGATGNVGIFNHYGAQEQQSSQHALFFREMYNRLHEISGASPGTCSWILENHTLRDWQNERRGLLWIKGKPGTGKSTIMKHMWNHFALVTGSRRLVKASFFCHGQGVNLQKTPSGVYRALLHQIVQQVPSLKKDFEEMFEARCRNQGPHGSKWDWTESELKNFAQDYLLKSCHDSETLILVDALDECGEDNAWELLDFLHGVVAASEAQIHSSFKVCVSSRHYPLARSDVLYEVIVDGENLADIRTYVAQNLELFRKSTQRYDELVSSIALGAGEIFQWGALIVVRVVRSLERKRPVELILQDIEKTPQKLFRLYRQIIRSYMDSTNTTPREKEQFCDLFRWVALAKRPLAILELGSALSVDHANRNVRYPHEDMSLGSDIEYLSCGLAKTAVEPDPSGSGASRLVVVLIHQSVQEYFVSGGGLQDLLDSDSETTTMRMAELDIIRTCYKSVLLSEPDADADAQHEHPLLDYALDHIFDHARSAEEGQLVRNDLVQILEFPKHDCVARLAKLQKLGSSSGYAYVSNSNLLHLAAYFDIPNLISCVLDLAPEMNINNCAPFGRTALHIAAEKGSFNAVDRLLEISQTLTSKPISLWRRQGPRILELNAFNREPGRRTPLMIAAGRGYSRIVERLAQARGTEVDKRDDYGNTALFGAIKSGHVDTAKVLIYYGANIRARNRRAETPMSVALFEVLYRQDERMGAKTLNLFWYMLTRARENLYSRPHLGGLSPWCMPRVYSPSPLQEGLSSSQSLEFARGLLNRGFDPHTPDRYGRVWFSYLSYKSNPGTLDLLQSMPGADINFKTRRGRTLLARLASSPISDCSMIKHLLENPEVDLCTKDKYGRTPLMIAAQEGSIEVVKVLLADTRFEPQTTKEKCRVLDYARKRLLDNQDELEAAEADTGLANEYEGNPCIACVKTQFGLRKFPSPPAEWNLAQNRAQLAEAKEVVALLESFCSQSPSSRRCA